MESSDDSEDESESKPKSELDTKSTAKLENTPPVSQPKAKVKSTLQSYTGMNLKQSNLTHVKADMKEVGETPTASTIRELSRSNDPPNLPPRPKVVLKSHPQIHRAQQEELEKSREEKLPRFLYRMFHPGSGGGHERLNTEHGVTPHAFLNGKQPTTMYDIGDLRQQITGHLCGRRIKTHFSSWAACFEFVVRLADQKGASIAMLDTTLLQEHVKIYHVQDLLSARLTTFPCPHEYLAYGPISGEAFHSVPWADIRPSVMKAVSLIGPIDAEFVALAKAVAAHFQRPSAKKPDVIIGVTAAVLGLTSCRNRYKPDNLMFTGSEVKTVLDGLAEELKKYEPSDTVTGNLGLVNAKTFTSGFPHLLQTVNLLLAVEEHLKSMAEMAKRPSHDGTRVRFSDCPDDAIMKPEEDAPKGLDSQAVGPASEPGSEDIDRSS
ncbi:hypothetical protein BJ170DRAFT_683426 [Xylariales sp. AK1849]|nr:hypothetical protein BJ170DRAFT_683426 [Xylariales sp. AK1849]